MFVPFFSKPVVRLSRRRGGGGGGGGGKGGGGGGGKGGGGGSKGGSSSGGKASSSSSGGRSGSSKSSSISSGGTKKTVSTYGNGGGKTFTIPAGQLFAGRTQGGATRSQIWGTRSYGSGYPGVFGRGVNNRGFPFYFWPIMWGTGVGYGADADYMHTNEYGSPDNSSRPGGPQSMAVFQSNSTNTIFRLVADNDTVSDLMPDVVSNCSMFLIPPSTNLSTPLNTSVMEPEQVVQYYRASTVALTLDGYNNTAVFAPENSTADTPLPAGIDNQLLDCLNATIGQAVPLVDGARSILAPPDMRFASLGLLLLLLLR
ncbi:hypothetical protein GGX14DRAFT_522430 [Mycena pura]|uniref:Uncharacterized protein n=1 Tax=Mycena pura TaxID=153505 RepID=A0AAD6V922_9AGAR|nr:hypothetical protein GGX14DRAFT_522430 [Mycena pura]